MSIIKVCWDNISTFETGKFYYSSFVQMKEQKYVFSIKISDETDKIHVFIRNVSEDIVNPSYIGISIECRDIGEVLLQRIMNPNFTDQSLCIGCSVNIPHCTLKEIKENPDGCIILNKETESITLYFQMI